MARALPPERGDDRFAGVTQNRWRVDRGDAVIRIHARTWLAVAVPLLATILVPHARAAEGELPGERLRRQFDEVKANITDLEAGIRDFRDGLLDTYECPPAEPNKTSARAVLDDFTMHRLDYLRTIRSIRAALESGRVGRATRGEALAGVVEYTDVEAVERDLTRTTQALAAARRDLESRPRTEAECEVGSMASFSYSPPSRLPGEVVRGQVTATSTKGKAMAITDVQVAGVDGVIGAFLGVNGLGTQNPTVRFRIDDVRRQGPFALNVTVSGVEVGAPPGSPPSSRSQRVSYRVANDPPRIVGTLPPVSADPGDALAADWTVTVIDRNADDQNPGEVQRGNVGLTAHPPDLVTTPSEAFRSFADVQQVGDYDSSEGRYTFAVERTADVAYPHRHGVYATEIRVTDRDGGSSTAPVELIVENVAPEGTLTIRPKRNYHANDGIAVEVVGHVTDGNGRRDIDRIEIDASPAGGARYTREDSGIVMTSRHDDGWSFRIEPKTFAHTRNPGEHAIAAVATDGGAPEQGAPEPERTQFPSSIQVGNDAPTMTATGFIYQTGIGEERRLCPRQLFEVASNARDPEQDDLVVTVEIVGHTPPQPMIIQPGETNHTLHLLAPEAPDRYTVRIRAMEADVTPANETVRDLVLIVEPCREETTETDETESVEFDVQGPPKSHVKITPAEPPPLPGGIPDSFLVSPVVQYAIDSASTAWMLDFESALGGYDEGFPLGASFRYSADLSRLWPNNDLRLAEDPVQWCEYGPAAGTEFEWGAPMSGGWNYWDHWRDGLVEQYTGDFYDEIDWEPPEGLPSADVAALARQAELRGLQQRARDLETRQQNYDEIREDLERQLDEARETGDQAEMDRIQNLIDEVQATQDAIEEATTPVYERLNELQASDIAARQAERAEIMTELQTRAQDEVEARIASSMTLQTAKEFVTTATRWASTGSEMQQQTARTTRIAVRELINAEVKLEVIDDMLADAEAGSTRDRVLRQLQTHYKGQRAAAEEMLDSNAMITGAGYTIDVVLTVSGAKLVQVGKTVVTRGAARAFSAQTAERVVATTTERGLIEVGKSAVGRGSAAAAGEQAAARGSRAAAEAGESALEGRGSTSVTDVYEQLPAEIVAEHAANDAVHQALQKIQQRADEIVQQNPGTSRERAWNEAWDEALDAVVGAGDDVSPPNTGAVREAAEAMDEAVENGRKAWENRPSGVDQARRAANLERAREIMRQRWGGENAARQAAGPSATARFPGPDFSAAPGLDPLGETTVFSLGAPLFLYGLYNQLGHDEDPVQAITDDRGAAELHMQSYGPAGGNFDLRLEGGGAIDGRYVMDDGTKAIPEGAGGYAFQVFQIGRVKYRSLFVPEAEADDVYEKIDAISFDLNENFCRDKAFGPFGTWHELEAPPISGQPYPSATLNM